MIVGIVAAKENSKRFPGKNKYIYRGAPIFWHSVKPLKESKHIDRVYVATDSDDIKAYCLERGVEVIWRPRNASADDEPLLGILRFAYSNLDQPYDLIATIMANCPGHTTEAVDRAVEHMKSGDFMEIRSFNASGEESGLMIFRREVITTYQQISSHLGCVRSDVKEVHYREDLNA